MFHLTLGANSAATIHLPPRFTFDTHTQFRTLLEEALRHSTRTLVFDFDRVTFIDSSGLGMLMLAKGEVEKSGGNVTLSGARGPVLDTLKLVRFDEQFTVYPGA
jgi:anti-anti-sigma factor